MTKVTEIGGENQSTADEMQSPLLLSDAHGPLPTPPDEYPNETHTQHSTKSIRSKVKNARVSSRNEVLVQFVNHTVGNSEEHTEDKTVLSEKRKVVLVRQRTVRECAEGKENHEVDYLVETQNVKLRKIRRRNRRADED
jgi:hypothetical protein